MAEFSSVGFTEHEQSAPLPESPRSGVPVGTGLAGGSRSEAEMGPASIRGVLTAWLFGGLFSDSFGRAVRCS